MSRTFDPRRANVRRALAMGLVCAATLVAPRALACDCPTPPPVEIALEKASAVVHVRVAHLSDYDTWHDGGSIGTTGTRTLRLAVLRSWRGEIAPNTTFDLVTDGDDCEHVFTKVGEEHVLYLHKRDGAWHVVTCGRSVQMGTSSRRNGESEIALLDKVAGKNAARWGGAPTSSTASIAPPTPSSSAATAPSSSAPASPPKAGGCAGCASAPNRPSPLAAVAAFVAIGALARLRKSLSRQHQR